MRFPRYELLQQAGRRRGFLLRGGEIDTERMARILARRVPRRCSRPHYAREAGINEQFRGRTAVFALGFRRDKHDLGNTKKKHGRTATARVCGVDEAGRGPVAGPVCAAAVILPAGIVIEGLNDSKKLSEKKREKLFDEITENALAWSVSLVDERVIDEINILQATYEAMRAAIGGLSQTPDLLLNDAVTIPGVRSRRSPLSRETPKAYP